MKKTKLSFSAILHNNKFVFIFAVITSIVIWFAVSYSQNTDISKTIHKVPVEISTDSTALKDLSLDIVGGRKYEVSVVIKCKRYQQNLIAAADIKASVDLKTVLAPDTYNLTVTAVPGNSNYDFTIESIEPEKIAVTFDRMKNIDIPVAPKWVGASTVEGLSVENAILADITNSTLNIKGPESTISAISSAVAEAQVNKVLDKTETFTATIILYDAEGAIIPQDDFELSFSKAQVTVPISKRKTFALTAEFINVPDAYKTTPIEHTLSVDQVMVSGPPDVIDKMTKLSLMPIDFGEITPEMLRFTRDIDLPSGVKLTDNSVTNARVTISSRNIIARTMNVTEFRFKGLPEGKTAAVTTALKDVRIAGIRASVNALKSANVYAELDLSDKTGTNEYEVIATIRFAEHGNVWAVNPSAGQYTVFVKIS